MSSVVDWLKSIAENIISLPVTLLEGLLEGIKSIFIPDTEAIKQDFNTAIADISSIIGLPIDSVQDAFDSVTGLPVEDVNANYNIPGVGTLKLPFFNTKFFREGMDFFRPLLRGFIVLMLFFYNYKQLLTFIGQDPGMFGRVVDDDSKKGGGKE